MFKIYFITLALALATALGMAAQVTSQPSPLQEDATGVEIFFHADQGNRGLAGLGPDQEIYAHTGVITSASASDSDWKYAPSWGSNLPKYRLSYVSENLWKLDIGDIRTYYGITNPSETISKLAFVFRNKDCSKEGKAVGNKDIFLDVVDSGLQISLVSTIEGDVVTPETADATFTIGTTMPADISLSVNGVKIASKENTTQLIADYLFENTGNGNFYVRADASADGKNVYTAVRYVYAEGSKPLDYPGGTPEMGANRNADGSVTFCLAAPGKTGVYLLGSWNDFRMDESHLMNYQMVDGFKYFWLNVDGLEKDTPYTYCFLVDGRTKVGDPYAKLVLDPSNDKYISQEVYPGLPAFPTAAGDVCVGVFQDNINDYKWTDSGFTPAPKEDLVIYELLLRDFTGTEGQKKGNGTVRKAMEKIPYLKSLGINAVELLPINEFNGNISWGYNPNFYFAPDKAYGTPDDYKELIDLLHAEGIAVILDVVFNQADWQHPWYKLYNTGSNPFFNATAPHAYSVLNDWNQGYPLVRQQWKDVVQYWTREYHVDGFRFDLVKGLGDNDSYPNSGDSGTNDYNSSRVANMKAIKEALDEVNPNAYFINENLAGAREENEMGRLGMLNWANVNHNGSQFAMGYQSDANLNRFYAPLDGGRLPGSTVSYLESHDEQRLAYQQDTYGAQGVKGDLAVSMHRLGSAAAQMIMAPGAHMIWQFSEMGNYDNTKDDFGGNNTDPKTVRWDLLDDPDRRGLVDNYSELIGIRLANTDLFIPTEATVSVNCGNNRWADGRYISCVKDDREIYTVVNPLVDNPLTISIPFKSDDDADYHILSCSYASAPAFSARAKTVTLAPNTYAVITTVNVSEVAGPTRSATHLPVFGVRGAIETGATGAPVEIYTSAGSRVAVTDGQATRISLPKGIYAARCGGQTLKVAVR